MPLWRRVGVKPLKARGRHAELVAAIAAFAEAPAVHRWLACWRFQRGCAVDGEPSFEVDSCNLLTTLNRPRK
jgi:hypothetical protein